MTSSPPDVPAARRAARLAAGLFLLPFRRRSWSGLGGNWSGAGTGSSIDFQDHRPYLPGDDPRHINWQAFARTGQFSMKLFREEVSPAVDLVLDTSASLRSDPAKATRFFELLYFTIESALASGAQLRCWAMREHAPRPLEIPPLLAGDFSALPPADSSAHSLARIPFRPGSLRVWLSDLLFEGHDEVRHLADPRGIALILCPYLRGEAEPEWQGNLELEDCESGRLRVQRVDAPLLDRYRQAYARHFALWQEQCTRHGTLLARIPAHLPLNDALLHHAVRAGALDTVG